MQIKTTKQTKQFSFSRVSAFIVLLQLFYCSTSTFAQSPTGVSINWNSYVGCQVFGEIRENGGKDPILIDDIVDGQCITVCRDSNVTFTLSGNLAANPNTIWSVTGGTITTSNNTSCTVNWNGLGSGNLYFTTTSLTGSVTKTICFDKIEIPTALFTTAPFSSAVVDLFGCTLQTIYFNNLSTTNGGTGLYSYLWDFGDGTTSTAFEPTHIYANDGNYSIRLTVTNSCGCTGRYAKEITIGVKGFNITCPSVVCEGQTTNYSLPFDGKQACNENFIWQVTGGSFTNYNDGTIDVTWNNVDASGFGYVTFDPSHCNLSCLVPTTIKIPVIQTRGTIIGNATTCLGAQERYVLPQWPSTIFNWSVVNNAGNVIATVIATDQRNEVIVEPLAIGSFTLRCEYINTLLHCGGTAEFNVDVINAIVVDGPEIICQNTVGNYGIPTGEYTSWELKNNTGVVISTLNNSASFNYTFTLAGNYVLTAGGLSGCKDARKEIKVIPTPAAPASISGDVIVCPDAPYVYSVPGSNPTGIYNWHVTGGTFVGGATGNSVVVQFTTAATHTLSVYNRTAPDSCQSNTTTLAITNKTINAGISAASSAPCANTNASYAAIQLGSAPETLFTDGESYVWSIWDSANTTPLPNLGSITNGQGTNSINILWNNTNSVTTATLRLVIKKCSITQTFTKIININTVPDLLITSPVNAICSGSPITFTLTTTNGVVLAPTTMVTWNYGNGVTETTTGLNSTYSFSNTTSANIGYNVTASVSNTNGCIGTAVAPVKVITVLPAPVAAISISSGGNAFCPPTPINTVLTATTSQGTTAIAWYKQGNPTVLSTANTLTVTDALGYGGYYIVATNGTCATTSNTINIVQFCISGDCIFSPTPTVTNTSSVGCITPTTSADCNCGIINLVGTASGTPLSQYWNIIGPNAANSFYNYNSTSIGTASAPLLPGEYNIFKIAKYTCTTGQVSQLQGFKKVTLPYYANFGYTVQCNANNFNISLLDTSPFFAPVTNRAFAYYIKLTSASTWTLVGSTPNATITNLAPGNYQLKLVITGYYEGNLQTPCEKILPLTLAANTVQTITASILPVSCYDTAIQFGLNGIGNTGDTYLWDFGDGATNTLDLPKHVFSSTGPRTVTLKITNRYGCLKPTLTYTDNPAIVVPLKCFNGTVTSNPPTATVCAGGSVTLQYTPANDTCFPPSSYVWMDGNTPLGITTSTLTVTTPGFYWVKVKSINNCSYDTPNRIRPVFTPLPSLNVSPFPTYCYNVPVPLAIATNAFYINWSIDGVYVPDYNYQSNVILPAGLAVGTHTITITVTLNNCTNTVTQNLVIVNSPPEPVIVSSLVSCNPYRVQLTATASFGTFNWSNGQQGATIIVSDGGPYQVTASAGGCSAKAQIDVPKNPEDYMWIFPSGCFKYCSNNLASLIGPYNVPFAAWEWLLDGFTQAQSVDSNVATYNVTQSGTYNLTLDNGLCTKTSDDLNFQYVECPACPIAVRIEKIEAHTKPFCNTTFELYITNTSGIALPITITSPNSDVLFTPTSFIAAPGINMFNIMATPTNGFTSGTIALFITGFNTKNDVLCTSIVTLDIPSCVVDTNSKHIASDKMANNMVIAPNPAKTSTTITYENATPPVIEVYTLLGVTIASYIANESKGSWEFNTSGLPAGVYVVVLKDKDTILQQKKLVLE